MPEARSGEGRAGEEILALHDELDALTLQKNHGAVITVFGFAAVLFFLLGLDMGSWEVLLGAVASGLVAGLFGARDVRRALRRRELRAELEARGAWGLLEPGEGKAGEAGGGLLGS